MQDLISRLLTTFVLYALYAALAIFLLSQVPRAAESLNGVMERAVNVR